MKKLIGIVFCAGLGAQTLQLGDVLESVERSYPPLLVALAEGDIASGETIAALGKFDVSLRARVETDQFGFYRNERVFTGFEQSLQTWGASVYGGWRVGDGSFAPYDGKLDTRSFGEWSGGLKLPLVRDRSIDSKRADLRRAAIGQAVARLSIDQQRLIIAQLATRRYWDWAAAGARRQMAQALLDIATARDHFLRQSVEAGQTAAIEVTENARAIVQRRSILVEAERALQQTSIDLSLFYRDDRGVPLLPKPTQLPASMPDVETIAEDRFERDLGRAFSRRPEVARLEAQRSQLQVDRQLASNDRMPEVDLQLGFTAEGGRGAVRRGPQEVKAALVFELPFQRRAATGKLLATDAKLRQFDQRLRFARDQITAEVRDAASAVRAAHDRAMLLRDEIKLARDLEAAERDRFQLGEGTLFLVNLREQATADAVNREISAVNDYFRALAQYEFAIGGK